VVFFRELCGTGSEPASGTGLIPEIYPVGYSVMTESGGSRFAWEYKEGIMDGGFCFRFCAGSKMKEAALVS
jgi:hypothetical protein